jgi:hypothetical protein
VVANDGFKDSQPAVVSLTVRPAVVTPPVLQVFEFRSDGSFHLRAGNVAAASRLERSTNLVDWTPVLTNGTGVNTLDFVDPAPAPGSALPYRFYRVRN